VRHPTPWIALALVLLWPAAPAAAGEDERSVLVFGPGSTNADGVVAAGYVRERLPIRERPDERVGVTGIPFPADRAYWLTGNGKVSWCAGAPPARGAETVGRAREALDLLESDRVLQIVDGYLAAAPCIDDALDAASLAELYLLRGLAHHVEGRAGAAREDFAAASGIHPELRWDVGYPPDPQQVYLVAREEALAAEPAHFGHATSLAAGIQVTVDGRSVDALALHDLTPGPHLIQVIDAGGAVTSAMLRLEPGQTAVLVDRYGATAMAMAGPASAMSRAASTTILGSLAAQWNVGSVVVVDTTYREELGEPRIYRFHVTENTFEPLSAIRTLRKHMPRHADRVRLGASAGVLTDGGAVLDPTTDLAATESHWGLDPAGSLEVRIGGGFTPRAALHIQLHSQEDGKLLATPNLTGGLGYRWRPRFVQTYVGLALHFRTRAKALGEITGRFPIVTNAETGEATALPVDSGLGIDVNVDIVTPRLPSLFFRVRGSAAYYASGSRTFSLGAGLGLRL